MVLRVSTAPTAVGASWLRTGRITWDLGALLRARHRADSSVRYDTDVLADPSGTGPVTCCQMLRGCLLTGGSKGQGVGRGTGGRGGISSVSGPPGPGSGAGITGRGRRRSRRRSR